ncbi:MAG TPA: DUF742 domain-containing protein [Pseudonocardia sp.]|jgi:hypothetical protein|nr:DUF742 domain-containing protein [Pseudonocardia sp.]
MTTGPDDERPEPTFADVLNGLTLGSGGNARKRRWGRRRGEDVELDAAADRPGPPAAPARRPFDPGPATGPIEPLEPEPQDGGGAAAVRPYAWTRGRTRSGLDLAIEALVSTSTIGRAQMAMLQVEHRAVAELCEQTRSVAEVAALLSLPLGVARVLLGDMAGLGVVTVHQTASSSGNTPDLALMERVLSGLRRL